MTPTVTAPILQASHRLSVPCLPGEFWWGGLIRDGGIMPWTDHDTCRIDLRTNHRGNQAQPMLISSSGRYVWSDQPFTAELDDGLWQFAGDAPITLSRGHANLRGALQHAGENHFPANGVCPDAINFTAPQYNTWIEMIYEPTQEKVLDYVQKLLHQGMPPGIFMIDDNWMEDYGHWVFHARRFPNPKAMIDRLNELGFKLVLWVCPLISPDHQAFRYLRDKGLLVRQHDGQPRIHSWWNGYSALLDLSHPDALAWMRQQLDRLVQEYGVSGFKFDAGDIHHYRLDDLTHRPTTPAAQCQAWNRLGLHYATSEFRAGWNSAGLPLIQRQCDKLPDWGAEGLADLIPNGLAQGLMGYAFNCPDLIGGGSFARFEQADFRVDQELFVRTTQCSTLFPIMQFSVAPWRVLDSTHLGYVMEMVRLRQKLAPEILALAQEAAKTGRPIMRSMAYVYPENGYQRITDQFLLGDRILVAPVTQPGQRQRTIVFPPGVWQGDDGSPIQGPVTQTAHAPLNRLPWYRQMS